MSEIQELVQEIKHSTEYQINKKILREKIQTDLHFTYSGGLFKATPELIAFVHAWRNTNDIWPWDGGQSMHMSDAYDNPIHIADCADFFKTACEHYHRVMNEWHQQHAEIKRIRKI
jgi:hypothetical protein